MTMSLFRVLTETEEEEWRGLVEGSPSREVFALPGYLKLFSGKGVTPFCAVYQDAEGTALYPGLLRDLSSLPFAESLPGADAVSPPYGYGGPFIDGGDELAGRLFAAWASWAKEHGVVAEYLTVSPKSAARWAYPGTVEERAPTVLRDLSLTDEETWADYKKSVRTDVRAAEKAGVSVTVDPVGEHAAEFLAIYESTMDRRAAAPGYRLDGDFLKGLHAAIPGGFCYLHAWHEGRIVSSELLLVSGDSTYFFRGGTLAEKLTTRANVMLKHEIIRWSRALGKRSYLLGGGNAGEDSLFKYKRAFAPEGVRMLKVGKWAIDPEAVARLTEARHAFEAAAGRPWQPRPGFFPPYRAPHEEA